MSLSQLRRPQVMKIAGISLVAVIAVISLIRCSPNEPAVAPTESTASTTAKDAETNAAAIAAAKATADGEKVADSGKKHKKGKRSIASVGTSTTNIYVVQIGAFKVKENAEKLEKKLKDAGYPVRMQSMNHSKNGELHLVRFEPSNNRAEAEAAVAQLKAKESITAELLTLPAGT